MKASLLLLLCLPTLASSFLTPLPTQVARAIRFEQSPKKETEEATQADQVAKQTKDVLESKSPKDMFEEPEEEEFQDQIFDPNMFWTERSGRFPTTH